MPRRRQPQRTSNSMKRFDTMFGAIFLGVGLVALAFGLLLYRLLSSDPDITGAWFALVVPTIVGTIFLVIGAYFFRHGLEQSQREQRLRASGTTADGTVVAVEPTSTRVNGQYLWHVRYVYDDLTGTAQMANSGYLSADDAQSYRVGQHVFVRYDPERPAESIFLGRDELSEA